MSNALSHFDQPALPLNTVDDHRLHLFYARYMEALFNAEAAGRRIQAPAAATAYMRHFVSEMQRCMAGRSPFFRTRSLRAEEKRFRRRQEGRARFPRLAATCADALLALATEERPGRAGSPARRRGATKFVERHYVNRAYGDLVALALSHGRLDWARELFKPGTRTKPSDGRRVVANYACKLADGDGVMLAYGRVTAQIREYVKKTPRPTLNAFLAYRAYKKRQPKRALIKAAGT